MGIYYIVIYSIVSNLETQEGSQLKSRSTTVDRFHILIRSQWGLLLLSLLCVLLSLDFLMWAAAGKKVQSTPYGVQITAKSKA